MYTKYDIWYSYTCILTYTHTYYSIQIHRRTIARIIIYKHGCTILYIYIPDIGYVIAPDQQISISEIEYITLAAVCSLYHYYPPDNNINYIYTLPHWAASSDGILQIGFAYFPVIKPPRPVCRHLNSLKKIGHLVLSRLIK